MDRDFEKHLQSISTELQATKERVRHLIGDVHWLTDGEHKEAIIRRILSKHVSDCVRVGSGFICYPHSNPAYHDNKNTSTQIDVLVTRRGKPTLYKEHELTIVTPDAVSAIVEVKTKRTLAELRRDLTKLANNAQKTREAEGSRDCWAGLFVFEPLNSKSRSLHRDIIQTVQSVVDDNPMRVINCVAVGENLFVRYWKEGMQGAGLMGQYGTRMILKISRQVIF